MSGSSHSGKELPVQIDNLVLSQWGIFVIEAKTYDGEITQSLPNAKRWRLRSRTGGEYRIQNPLFQNRKHIQALSACLKLSPECFHSIVAFAGTTDFISQVPENVMRFKYVAQYIREHSTTSVLHPEIIAGLVRQVRDLSASVPKSKQKELDNANSHWQEQRKQQHSSIQSEFAHLD